MADNKNIAFKLNIDGVEQSIKSVKDLKGAIKALQDEAESADIGSENYKNAIENIELLNEKLKEVTQTEKQSAQAMEDMANAQKEATKETQDLRKQFEVLEDQLFLLAGQGKQNTKEFRDLSAEAAKLNGKIDQVNQTLGTGASGVDKLSGSFGMLSEGLTSMNFDKVKAGFKGIGQAMSAVPLMLLVTGITMLAEKFELFKIIGEAVEKLFYAITDAMGLTSKAAEEQTASMIAGMQKQQDAINGRYDKEIKLSKAAGEDTILMEIEKSKAVEASAFSQLNTLSALGRKKKKFNDEEQKQYDDLQKALYDAQLNRQVLETTLEKKKQDEQKANNEKELADKIAADAKAAENSKKYRDANLAMIKQIEDAKIAAIKDEESRAFAKEVLDNERRVRDIKGSESSEKLKNEMLLLNAQQYENNLAKINADGAAKRKAIEDKAIADKAAADAKALADKKIITDAENAEKLAAAQLAVLKDQTDQAALLAQLQVKRDIALQDATLTASQKLLIEQQYQNDVEAINKAAAEKEKALELAKQNEILNFAQMSTQSHQALSDAFFAVKNRNLQKGSAAERKSAEQQFKINKALAIQSAVISGIQGVINALSAQSVVPEPFGTVLKVATAVGVGIAAAANIAKIASTKFDAGGGGGGGGGGATLPSAPPIPSPPSISTQQNNTNQSTSFDETGKRIGSDNEKQMTPVIQVKATVGVDEVSSKTNRVETLEKQSTF